MYTNPVRFTIAALALAAAAGYSWRGQWTLALLFLVGALLLVAGYFRSGTLWLASRAYRRQDRDRTEKLLSQIRYPHLLQPRARPHYYFMKGILTFSHDRLEEAEPHLSRALALGRLSPGSVCMIHCMLATIQASRGHASQAQGHLESARALPHPAELDALIASTEGRIAGGDARLPSGP